MYYFDNSVIHLAHLRFFHTSMTLGRSDPPPGKSPCFLRIRLAAYCKYKPIHLIISTLSFLPLSGKEPETISEITVRGARRIAGETVIQYAGLHLGEELQDLKLSQATEKLWNTGLFENIVFSVEDNATARDQHLKQLVITVTENPLIKEVAYRGGSGLDLSALQTQIKNKPLPLKPPFLFHPENARKVKDLIHEQCLAKGYRHPAIHLLTEKLDEGTARLVFDIQEGPKTRVYGIQFRGNKALSNAELSGFSGAMKKVGKHHWLSFLTSKDLLVTSHLEEDRENLKKAYWRLGYRDVHIGEPFIEETHTEPTQKQLNPSPAQAGKSLKTELRANIVIPIYEGEQYFEGKLEIQGNEKQFRGKKGLRALTKLFKDAKSHDKRWFSFLRRQGQPEPMNLDAIDRGAEKVREAYGNASYIQCSVEKHFTVREEKGQKRIDTLIKLQEGEPYSVRRIRFEGNRITKDKILRRSFKIQETEPFQLNHYRESFTGIGQLGFFRIHDAQVDTIPGKSQVDITVQGREAALHDIIIQAGYNQLQKVIVGTQLTTRNLFGNGETLGLNVNYSSTQRNFSLQFFEPYLFDRPYSLSASMFDQKEQYDTTRVGADYASEIRSRGINIGSDIAMNTLAWFRQSPWAQWTRYNLGYSLRKNHAEGNIVQLMDTPADQLTSSINQGLTYSTVNSPFSPSQGFKASLSVDFGGWQFGGEKPYYRFGLELAQLANISERHFFGAGVKYYHLAGLGRNELPIWLIFRPGGESSLRGYRPGAVGSVMLAADQTPLAVGGNRMLVANAEYQLKLTDLLRLVLFFDAGNAWLPGEKLFNRNSVEFLFNGTEKVQYNNPALVRSSGLELRIFLPISPAPVRLIWARKLDQYPHDQDSRTQFQFTIGTMF